jgi:hypothetical protein
MSLKAFSIFLTKARLKGGTIESDKATKHLKPFETDWNMNTCTYIYNCGQIYASEKQICRYAK